MNEEFYRRQAEKKQEHQQHGSPNSTMETYQLEQQEAHSGHLPSSKGTDAVSPDPTLWQRLKKMLGMK